MTDYYRLYGKYYKMGDRRIIARCPASCGELIQGIIKGKEQLVSFPVNIYSNVTIGFGKRPGSFNRYPKVSKVIVQFLNCFGLNGVELDNLYIEVDSQIPIGKGMASSTADIASALFALSNLLELELTSTDIAKLAVIVDPTDSTVFEQLTLFDHLHGRCNEVLGSVPDIDVLVLEGAGIIDTLTFRSALNYLSKVMTRDNALIVLKKGLEINNLSLIGKAATESAILNQCLLNKPYLEILMEIADKNNAYGVSVAHSGTVCGVLCSNKTDIEALQHNVFKSKQLCGCFIKSVIVRSVKGGPEIIDVRSK